MKKLTMFFLVCILTGYSCMVCSAGSDTLEEDKEATFGIYATYIAGETDYFTAPVKNGESELSLPDGTVIAAGSIPEDGLTLVVYPVTDRDKDAWKWFSACMEGKGRNIVPYEIYFLNKDGDRLLADGVTVSILLPESMETPAAFSLGRDGKVTELASEIVNGKIVFQADGRYYYVLAERTASAPAPDGPDTPESGTGGNDQGTGEGGGVSDGTGTGAGAAGVTGEGGGAAGGTGTAAQGTGARTGDETNVAFWLFVFISSAMVFTAGMIFRHKRASGRKNESY
ncbi:MAG: hypothetical protein Q4C58_14840 [Eubacteriales bacterium]|nr:hypothetical protein [Eubacteriales bacterium]